MTNPTVARLSALVLSGLLASAAALPARAQGAAADADCTSFPCGRVESIRQTTVKQSWTPLGQAAGFDADGRSVTSFQIGPGMSNQGMVVLGASGGAGYTQVAQCLRPAAVGSDRQARQRPEARAHRRLRAVRPRRRSSARRRQQPRAHRLMDGPWNQVVGPASAGRPRRLKAAPRAGTDPRGDGERHMAALAITDTADGRRILALSGRLDATTLPALWDKARRAADEAAAQPLVVDAAGVEYCDGAGVALFVELLRHPREGTVEVANLGPAVQALLAQFDPKVLEHDLDPEAPRRPAVEEIGFAAWGLWRDFRTQVEFIGETTAALALRRAPPAQRALEGRLAHLRAGGRRRAADRRADLVPARHDPGVPVGGADEALRRRDLRRRPDRPRRCCASSGR